MIGALADLLTTPQEAQQSQGSEQSLGTEVELVCSKALGHVGAGVLLL